MLTMTVGRAKGLFFDRAFVIGRIDAATRQALSRGGAIVMRSARKSISDGTVLARGRVREGETRRVVERRTSRPGQPPFSQTGLLRDHILFAFDPASRSVVVGPARLGRGTGAPETLEFGGTTIVERRRDGRRERSTVRIAARPYMAPALAREASRLPEQLRNSVVRRT
jgi:hypothetical protein